MAHDHITTENNETVEGSTFDRLGATLALDSSATTVRAVSAARATALSKLKITTVRDLVTHYPRRYIDMSTVASIADAPIGQTVTLVGEVFAVTLKRPKPRLTLTEITLVDQTGTCMITCFRQPWLADKLKKGTTLSVAGKLEFNYGYKRMTNPFLEVIETGSHDVSGMIVPVHPATEKVPTAWMRRLVANALEQCAGAEDPLPLELRLRYRLCSRQVAWHNIHFPHAMAEADQARRRLVYEELLMLETYMMQQQAAGGSDARATSHRTDGPAVKAFQQALPFTLSDEQVAARDEIFSVMHDQTRANHMLLGDVGTGKTAVAGCALAAVADTGTQALMMAPTEVLASQYAQSLGSYLEEAGVTWGLLTASTPAQQRDDLLQALGAGSLQVLFGTHALLNDDVVAPQCSLVVIDEQQRFGVEQRAALVAKGAAADVLSLTATPIPRSLALALFGSFTLSYIHHRPGNRAGNTTRVFPRSLQNEAYGVALEALEAGHQVFIVCPLVGQPVAEPAKKGGNDSDESDEYAYANISIESETDFSAADSKAVVRHAEFLRDKVFPGYQVGVLHGKMGSKEKREAMEAFRRGDTSIMVATTVIEVGVDVPNATVMVVEDADRFGLSQLHQLRGRVGRGDTPGTVCLISGSQAPHALQRLAAMEKTEDGFELAEYDLSLRREGDILGNRQHGASVLKLVNVVRDKKTIEAAHSDAREIIAQDPQLLLPQHKALAREIAIVFSAAGNR